MTKNKEDKALVTTNSNLPAQFANMEAFHKESMKNTMDNIEPQLLKIKVVGGGVNKFQIDGREETPKKIKGIIIGQQKSYALWSPRSSDPTAVHNLVGILKDLDMEIESTEIPICSSSNGYVSKNRPDALRTNDGKVIFGDCHQCHFFEFGSDLKGGKGKACKTGRMLLIMFEDEIIPRRFLLSPTSVRPFDAYCTALFSFKLTPAFVYTTIEIDVKSTKDGIEYPVCNFVLDGKPEMISEEDAMKVPDLYDAYKVYMTQEATRDEVDGEITKTTPIETEAKEIDPDDEDLPF